jgi:hypothetical protein
MSLASRTGTPPSPRVIFAALNDLFAEDLLWHAAGRNQLAGEHRGREAVYGFSASSWRSPRDRSTLTCIRSWPTTSTASRWRSPRPARAGRSMEVNEAHVFHLRFWLGLAAEHRDLGQVHHPRGERDLLARHPYSRPLPSYRAGSAANSSCSRGPTPSRLVSRPVATDTAATTSARRTGVTRGHLVSRSTRRDRHVRWTCARQSSGRIHRELQPSEDGQPDIFCVSW